MQEMQHVFIVGAKSLGAYGGYETFVNKLTEYHAREKRLQYHVACKGNGVGSRRESTLEGMIRLSRTEFMYHNAHCFKVFVPKWLGPAQAVWYDVAALKRACEIIRRENIPHPIVYILACRIGPFMAHWVRRIHALGGQVFLNPDGHEWKRGKWPWPIKRYWRYSEGQMVTRCDRVICDSAISTKATTANAPAAQTPLPTSSPTAPRPGPAAWRMTIRCLKAGCG